jgi:hypothetical protein
MSSGTSRAAVMLNRMAKISGTPGKKPPARSVRRRAPRPTIKAQIAAEIHQALEDLGAGPELLAVIGSWGDTLDDGNVLRLLRDYNAGRPTLRSLR